MNNIITMGSNSDATMNSREIADLLETQHGNVRISIERLAKRGVIQLPSMQLVEDIQSLSPNNKTQVYIFTGEQGKRDSIIVVAQLSPEFTARLVDRWQALEVQVRKPVIDLSDPAFLRTALLNYTEKVIALENKVDALTPRAAVADRLEGSTGLFSIRDAAKALKMPERKFINWLLMNKWMYRDQKHRLRGYAAAMPKYIEHKPTPLPTPDDPDHVGLQAMITPAGLTKLADIFNIEQEVDFAEAA